MTNQSTSQAIEPWKFQIQGQQALIMEENGHANIAVVYDPKHAPLLTAAPKLLQQCMDSLADVEGYLSGEIEPSKEGYEATIRSLEQIIKEATANA